MANSVHTARWITQLDGMGWDVHIFDVYNQSPHPKLRNLTVYSSCGRRGPDLDASVHLVGLYPFNRGQLLVAKIFKQLVPSLLDRARWLAWIIRWLKPDMIHSLEIQHAGYLCLAAKYILKPSFPPWIVTNWGSDIYLFGRLAEHASKIRTVLESCDYYACECRRDVLLARKMGLRGRVLPVLPNTGGFDLAHLSQLRQPGPSSERRLVLLKGYQHWAGRALVGLRAIELCARELQGYRVAIYSAYPDVKIAAELVSNSTGIPIEIIPHCPHDEMLRLHGHARISIGLSIGDAISTSLIEAMVMGSFPIQSCTACADEWIIHGETGLIVPPEDPAAIASAIRQALLDDRLVDQAAERNCQLAKERLDETVIRHQVMEMYHTLADQIDDNAPPQFKCV